MGVTGLIGSPMCVRILWVGAGPAVECDQQDRSPSVGALRGKVLSGLTNQFAIGVNDEGGSLDNSVPLRCGAGGLEDEGDETVRDNGSCHDIDG